MIIVSSTGGSGSSFMADFFKKNSWEVCLRPDGGKQKATHTVHEIFKNRTKKFFKNDKNFNEMNLKELFEVSYSNLNNINNTNIMLLSMSWGGLGYLNNLPEKTIFLVRDPVFAFNSYSGGGWRSEGGLRRIKYVNAKGPNDKIWIDAFLGSFSMWLDGANNALEAHKNKTGHIVRYHNLAEDWNKIKEVPKLLKEFEGMDDIQKVKNYLSEDTIKYIKEKTQNTWNEISNLEIN